MSEASAGASWQKLNQLSGKQPNQLVVEAVDTQLSPSAAEVERANRYSGHLASILGQQKCFMMGSRTRGVAISPSSDVDMVCLVEAHPAEPADAALNHLAGVLEEPGRLPESELKIGPHCLELKFSSTPATEVQVVPAIWSHQQVEGRPLYWVPRRKQEYDLGCLSWQLSDPFYYAERAMTLDYNSQGAFRPAVKLAKAWMANARAMQPAFNLKPFHLELIIGEVCSANPEMDSLDLLETTLAQLPRYVAMAPFFADSAEPNRFRDAYLTEPAGGQPSNRLSISSEAIAATNLVGELKSARSPAEVQHFLKLLTEHPSFDGR